MEYKPQLLREILPDFLTQVDERRRKGTRFLGMPTGFGSLDFLLQGLVPQCTTLVGGTMGTGKSALLINMLMQQCYRGFFGPNEASVFFTAEMPAQLWLSRVLSWCIDKSGGDILAGNLSDDQFKRLVSAAQWLADQPIFLVDNPAPTTMFLRQALARLCEEGCTIPVTYLDYVGKLVDESGKESSVADKDLISSALGSLVRETGTHLVYIHDLSREAEKASGPSYAHVRGSTRPAYDADNIVLLHAPDLENFRKGGEEGQAQRFLIQFRVVKNRICGAIGVRYLEFDYRTGRYYDPESDEKEMIERYDYLRDQIREAEASVS